MTNPDQSNQLPHGWQAETTHPKLMENFRQNMREIKDPELGLNIIELGLIRDVIIDNSGVQINMILTTPFCPYGPAMLEMVREKAESLLEKPVTVEMGLDMWDQSMMEEGAEASWGWF